MAKPLDGLRILDLTHMLSGPYAGMILADLGAETIKVEPLKGEGTRALLATDPRNSIDGQGAYFITLNRNKQSVAVDLKSEAGLEVFFDLVRRSDVVLDNFSAGVSRKLGIDYEALKSVNKRIVTCSISGFGSAGPDYQRPAFDQVIQALGGGMSITGRDANDPMRAGVPIADLSGGMFAVMGILAALNDRDRSGEGQHVDVSMLDCQISLLNYMVTTYFLSGDVPEPAGNSHFVHVPYNTYPTADGHIVIAVIFDSFWDNLVEVIDEPAFADPKYRTQPGRLEDRRFIDARIAEILQTQPSNYWLERLEAKRIPCARVNRVDEALADPQVLSRNMVVDLEHPSGKSTKGPGNPIKMSRTDEETFSPAPLLGEHTDDVLTNLLGYSAEQVNALRSRGVIT